MALRFMPRKIQELPGKFNDGSHAMRALIHMHGNPGYVTWFDDFVGDSAGTWPASANWGYPATAGTGTEVIAISNEANGSITMTTGANANDSAGQAVGLHWTGDTWIYFYARCKLNTLASSVIEIGLNEAVTGDTGAVDTKATPTFTSTHCALFVRDTTDDTNITFVTNGGAGADGNSDWDGTFSADTYYDFEIVVGGPDATSGNFATGYINGQRVGSGSVDGSQKLTPWLYVETLTTATRTMTVDYGGCIGRRSAT